MKANNLMPILSKSLECIIKAIKQTAMGYDLTEQCFLETKMASVKAYLQYVSRILMD